jgi:hypothetical protein
MMAFRGKGSRSYRAYRFSWFFRGFLFLGGMALIFLFLLYTQSLMVKLKENATSVSNAYAKLLAVATYSTTAGPELNVIFEEVIRKTDFPIILTDADGIPQVWKQVPVPWDDETPQARARLLRLAQKLDRQNDPIPLQTGSEDQIIGYLHYGESQLIRRLGWLPYVEVVVVICFVLIWVYGFQNIKKSEQRYIWVGMAKETAHQFGTPLSSLMGWLELMKDQVDRNHQKMDPEDYEKFDSMVLEMKGEVDRLSKIASRFGKIGSAPELERTDIVPVLTGAVAYIRRRLPRVEREIKIIETYEKVPLVAINKDLLIWVVENLIKNSLDAITERYSVIRIVVEKDRSGKCVNILIKDQGRGISPKEQKRIFLPGYTTKKRGWGLGLTLAKRIVEEYHRGKLYLAESKPKRGSTFVVSLPVA